MAAIDYVFPNIFKTNNNDKLGAIVMFDLQFCWVGLTWG